MRTWLLIALLIFLVAMAHGQSSKTPINNGILQSNLDAAGYKILNANLVDYAGVNITWNTTTKKFDATGGGGGNPLQWDGGATNLVAATGRTSLGLVIGTNVQAFDADLTSLAGVAGTNTIYYRSAADTWSPVTIGGNMTFSGGTLNSVAGGAGTVTTTGSPATGNLTKFSGATSISNGDLTGDVTTTGTLATTIGANKVTLGDLATMATDSILGRATATTGNVEVLAALPFAFTGDVTRPVDSNAQTIANSAVIYAKMQNVSANAKLLGSNATGSGAPPSEITLGTNLSMTASTLNAAGTVPGGSNTYVQFNDSSAFGGDANFVWDKTAVRLGLSGGATSTSRFTIGSLEFQPYALNNAWFGDNAYFDGAAFKYRATGSAGLFYFSGTEGQFRFIGSGTAGTSWASTPVQLKVNSDGSVALGGPGNTAAGTYTNSLFLVKGATAQVATASNYVHAWSGTSADASAAVDAGIGRNTAGVLEINNGTLGTFRTLKDDVTNAVTGFQVNGAAASGKILQGNGTNYVASTPIWPTTAGTAGYLIQSNGTNFVTYPTSLEASSTTTVSAGYAADTYLAGSTVTLAAGDWKVQGVYHCKFDMTKTGAGTATPIITVRMGTLGTTGDAAIGALTFGAGTGVVDSGVFDIDVVFRSVGSGTSAVIQMLGECGHGLAATGLTSTGAAGTGIIVGTSAGFNSTTPTKLGLSVNFGASFSGTNTFVSATLHQP